MRRREGRWRTRRRAVRRPVPPAWGDDRGASAVELAVITAVLVALAVLILGIIVTFAKNQGSNITNTQVPNPANGGANNGN